MLFAYNYIHQELVLATESDLSSEFRGLTNLTLAEWHRMQSNVIRLCWIADFDILRSVKDLEFRYSDHNRMQIWLAS